MIELEEGHLKISYLSQEDEKIEQLLERFIQTSLRTFGYELISSSMLENNTRTLLFDKVARNY